MKRQLTRKLSTAEFAHSHSGHGPPPNVARSWFNVGARRAPPTRTCHDGESCGECTSLRPGPFTYTHAYHLSVLGVCRAPPPRVSPVSARRRAAARALRQRGMGRGRRGVAVRGGSDGGGRRRGGARKLPRWPPLLATSPPTGERWGYQRLTFGVRKFIITGIVRCHLSRAHAHLGRPRDVAGPHRRGVCERGGRTRL